MTTALNDVARRLSSARLLAICLPNGLLWGAIGFQVLGGFSPCEMCMWQRWPHVIAIGLALAAIALRRRMMLSATLTALAAFAILTSGVIGTFHAGVEYGWWQGITTCSTSQAGATLDAIMNAPLVRCDVAPWQLAGISMAGYNALFSIGGALLILGLIGRRSTP
jgi:disulfide bond formation protein DsbB